MFYRKYYIRINSSQIIMKKIKIHLIKKIFQDMFHMKINSKINNIINN